MAVYAAKGYTFDLAETSTASAAGTPVRDASGAIVASISVTSTDASHRRGAHARDHSLVQSVARKISMLLGAGGA